MTYCPLCKRGFGFFVRPSRDIYWSFNGGADAVCKSCAKKRIKVIIEHNEIFNGRKEAKKNPECKHEWIHPSFNRWFCIHCGAQYNWLCGCGGSLYVCNKHYEEFIGKNNPIEEYLARESW